MAELYYCPKCDTWTYLISQRCNACKGRTITINVRTERYAAGVLVMTAISLVIFIAFMASGIIENTIINVLTGSVLFCIVLFASIFTIEKRWKPTIDAALERARVLYNQNKEYFDAGQEIVDPDDMPVTQFPWAIRNVWILFAGYVVSLIMIPVPIGILWLSPNEPGPKSIMTCTMIITGLVMVAMVFQMMYSPAKKHLSVIRTLKLKPEQVKKEFKSLKVRSQDYGSFELKYDPDFGYRLRIYFEPEYSDRIPEEVIWARPSIMRRFDNDMPASSKYMPMSSEQLEAIKSLKEIKIENRFNEKTLLAIINDRAFSDESEDIAYILRLLVEIKEMLVVEYSTPPG